MESVTLRPIPDRRQGPERRAQWRSGRRAIDVLAARVIGEYSEQPGLKLTLTQAARLFGMDVVACDAVFGVLVLRGPLVRTPTGEFVMFPVARPRRVHGLPSDASDRRRRA